MSEQDFRPAPSRGRSSVRGGRGGFGRGGPRGGHRQTNGISNEIPETSHDDDGDIGDLKKQYSSQLPLLKDVFPDWTDVDLVFALQETDGDLQTTIEKITEGHISQFSEIKKPKDRARSKPAPQDLQPITATQRGGRGRGGLESARGGRGRGDRARGIPHGGRGASAAPRTTTNEASGSTAQDTAAWPSNEAVEENIGGVKSEKSQWENVVVSDVVPKTAAEGAKPSLLPKGSAKKTWASMFSLPKAAPAPVPKTPAAQATPQAPAPVEVERPIEQVAEPANSVPEILPPVTTAEETHEPPVVATPTEKAGEALEPPRDPLTEDNLENLPDSSIPPATQTVASTVGSDAARQATPLTSSQQAPIGRPMIGGYASSLRATTATPRSASFQKRILEQQEALVMPGHNAVDRAAVQFGSMGLNGNENDVDEEREEAETRTQPPAQSPAQPRASLPPATMQSSSAQQAPEAYSAPRMPTPKQAPGLPPVNQNQQQIGQHNELAGSLPQQGQQQSYPYGRYNQGELPSQTQKSYDPFSHQTPSSFDQFSQSHQQSQQQSQQQNQHGQQHSQQQSQQQPGGYGNYSSAPSDSSHYYTSDQQRQAYQNYYGNSYGQSQQDSGLPRTSSGLGSAQNTSGLGSSASGQQNHSTYNEQQSSEQQGNLQSGGHSQHSQQQSQHSQQPQHQQQSQYNAAYPYGHPYYTSPYAAAYQNQFGYNYGNGPYGKQGGMYGQHQGYGPSSYDHSSSPASTGYNQQQQQPSLHSRDSGLGHNNAGEYGRTTSSHNTGLGGPGYGTSDYGRTSSGYGAQSQAFPPQHGAGNDDLKSYNDSKTGPSPGPGAQQNRPGSAANSSHGQGQSGLPPSQNQQQGFGGGYGGFDQRGQYGSGLGGLGGGQHGGQGGYGQQYGQGFGQSYNQYGRGGWGQSYGH